jgi:flagellar biosynthesis/type III secretory pathway chaperone
MNRILPVAEFCYDIYSLCKILEHSNLNNGWVLMPVYTLFKKYCLHACSKTNKGSIYGEWDYFSTVL